MSIFVKHTQPFTAVPNHLVNNDNISANALAVITYLAGKPTGWIARSYDIKRRFKWGDYTWRCVSKELRALGLLRDISHSEGKQLIFELEWEIMNKPVDKPCDPPVDFQQVQKPTVGNQRVYKERLIKKDLLEKKTSLGRQLSVDNSEQLPTASVPTNNNMFKRAEGRIGSMSANEEQASRMKLAQQFKQLTGVEIENYGDSNAR